MRTKGILTAALIATLALPAGAAELEPRTRDEIAALIDSVRRSDCEFIRKNTAYSASDIGRLLDYRLAKLLDSQRIASAEQFIELAATKGSKSGKPYMVQCGGRPAVRSADWLKQRLATIRKQRNSRPS